jgi:hypothetical protein
MGKRGQTGSWFASALRWARGSSRAAHLALTIFVAAEPEPIPLSYVNFAWGRERSPAMQNAIRIDRAFRRAIIQDIGERLRASLREEPELSASLRRQIDQLREMQDGSPSIMPDANSRER